MLFVMNLIPVNGEGERPLRGTFLWVYSQRYCQRWESAGFTYFEPATILTSVNAKSRIFSNGDKHSPNDWHSRLPYNPGYVYSLPLYVQGCSLFGLNIHRQCEAWQLKVLFLPLNLLWSKWGFNILILANIARLYSALVATQPLRELKSNLY